MSRWPDNCGCVGCQEAAVRPDPEVAEAVRRLRRSHGRWFGEPTGGPSEGCLPDCACRVCEMAGGGCEELLEVW